MQVYFEDRHVGNLHSFDPSRYQSGDFLRIPVCDFDTFVHDEPVNDYDSPVIFTDISLEVAVREIRIDEYAFERTPESLIRYLRRYDVPQYASEYKSIESMQVRYRWLVAVLKSVKDFEEVFDMDSFEPV